MTVSQNNQQNALPNGLGGVSLQTYKYDAMNRLTHSSGGNSDAGVSYNFQQTYSPSGRIGDKTCDFTLQNDGFYYDASRYQMHALRKTIDGTTGVPCDFIYDENGNMQGYSVKNGAFVSYNIWNAANQMVATGNTRACGYYGYGYDGKRRYKLTGKTSVMSANAGDVVMDFSFDDYVLYPNSFITGTRKGYTKHYYAGCERIASRLMNCWHFNKNLDQYLNDSEQQILDALALSNYQFDYTFKERPAYMNYYAPDSVIDIYGNKRPSEIKFPILRLAGCFKKDDIVHYNCEMLADNECKSELYFTHSDHLGSSSWTTDENGYAIQHIEYLPFGEEFINQRTTSYEDRYTFTGKELDAESNLYYYDAKYNSSTYSQFTSPDPMSDKYPSVSPYLYCAGNRIMYVDPTGMDYAVSVDDEHKTITISATFVVSTSEDEESAQEAIDLWNKQTNLIYSNEVDGINDYQIVFDLDCINNSNMNTTEREELINNLKEQGRYNVYELERLPAKTKSNMDNDTEYEQSGHTSKGLVKVNYKYRKGLTGAHEVGHALGISHELFGLMTDTGSSIFRCEVILRRSVRKSIEGDHKMLRISIRKLISTTNIKLKKGKVKRSRL